MTHGQPLLITVRVIVREPRPEQPPTVVESSSIYDQPKMSKLTSHGVQAAVPQAASPCNRAQGISDRVSVCC